MWFLYAMRPPKKGNKLPNAENSFAPAVMNDFQLLHPPTDG
jgi:hypothetical protein